MHYRNGRPAKNGDKIVVTPPNGGTPYSGILYGAVPGNDSCNGRVAITQQNDPYVNLKEALHAEDVAAAGDTIPDTTPPAEQVHEKNTTTDPGHKPFGQ